MSSSSNVSIGRNSLPERAVIIENIRSMYLDAISHGFDASWYSEANSIVCDVAIEYSLPVESVAGVIAALSPSLSWGKNTLEAKRLISWFCGNQDDTLEILPPAMIAYPANVNKAIRILHGENPMNVLGGSKVTAFYQNIVNPAGDYFVTIDRHAIAIAMYGLQCIGKSTGSLVPTMLAYLHLAQAYRIVASEFGLLPSEVQSITWSYLTSTQNGKGK